ncbi:MAG: hypothetical protein CXZ00_02475 [Acidobacteria bacterium]|nr:MAG: hypothetical protein CXZ00_02475 [Acidobacteriota bacterium]
MKRETKKKVQEMSDIHPNVAASGFVPGDCEPSKRLQGSRVPAVNAASQRARELYRNLKLLFTENEHVVCVRMKSKSDGIVLSGNFDNFKKLALIVNEIDDDDVEFTYICTNPADPAKVAVTNCLEKGESLKGDSVLCRHNLLVDIDTVKRVDVEVAKIPKLPANATQAMINARQKAINKVHQQYGDVATEAEKLASAEVRDRIIAYLHSVGFADPIVSTSGNGWHLIYRLPNLALTEENELLVERVQLYLKQTFSVPGVCKIDVLKDANRMTRFYGSYNRKGIQTDTPYWKSGVITTPKPVEPTSLESLMKVAEQVPAREERKRKLIEIGDARVEDWMMEKALEAYSEAGKIAGFDCAGDGLWNLYSCPWEEEHSSQPGEDTIQVSLRDGVIGFNDLRESCQCVIGDDGRPYKRTWRHFRDACDPDRKLYRFPIEENECIGTNVDFVEIDMNIEEIPDEYADIPRDRPLTGEEMCRVLGARLVDRDGRVYTPFLFVLSLNRD